MCRKRKYETKIDAQLTLLKVNNQFNNGNYNRKEKRIYFCNHCLSYHITSKVGKHD